MEKLFLVTSTNGNGESYLLILFDEGLGTCQKHFKTSTLEKMAKHLGEEHLESVEDRSIVSHKIPCAICTNKKKCAQRGHLELLTPAVVEEIYRQAENENRDNITAYLNEDE